MGLRSNQERHVSSVSPNLRGPTRHYCGRARVAVLDIPSEPLRLVRRAIVASSREGDLVFDPFCGSGTSGVAAKELGRFFVGAEKEEEYAELAARRIEAVVRGQVLREIPDLSAGEGYSSVNDDLMFVSSSLS